MPAVVPCCNREGWHGKAREEEEGRQSDHHVHPCPSIHPTFQSRNVVAVFPLKYVMRCIANTYCIPVLS